MKTLEAYPLTKNLPEHISIKGTQAQSLLPDLVRPAQLTSENEKGINNLFFLYQNTYEGRQVLIAYFV